MLGEPGAGKTWTLLAVAKPLYEAAIKDERAPIPLFVKLANWTDERSLHEFIMSELRELGTHLDALLDEKRAALLLDGLNEVPAAQRADKYRQVERFIRAHPALMALVTCREQDYTVDLDFDRVVITPLDPPRILDFLRRRLPTPEQGDGLFWKLAGDPRLLKVWQTWERAGAPFALFWNAPDIPRENPNVYGATQGWEDTLWKQHIRQPSSLMTLARSPYMLEMLARVFERLGVLPENRGDLFRGFVETLLLREGLASQDGGGRRVALTTEGNALLEGLVRLAYAMQIQRAERSDEDEISAQTSLGRAEAERLLSARLLYLAGSASLLVVSDEVRFAHQLLQEYFAARYMQTEIEAGRLRAADLWKPENWWERNNWEEATILLAGLYTDDCAPVLNWLVDANPEIAAQCIARSGAHTLDETKTLLRDQWLPRLTDVERDPEPKARAAVGRALGLFKIGDEIADNRPGVGTRCSASLDFGN